VTSLDLVRLLTGNGVGPKTEAATAFEPIRIESHARRPLCAV
jgi:hypothetical protein